MVPARAEVAEKATTRHGKLAGDGKRRIVSYGKQFLNDLVLARGVEGSNSHPIPARGK